MNPKRKRLGAFAGVALALLVVFSPGCTDKEDDGNLMVFHGSIPEDVKSWDPATANDIVSQSLVPSVFQTLYQYSYLSETYKVVPLLAADIPKVSPDRLTITIPIRHQIHFQDDPCFKDSSGKGRELKAQDFVYGLKRLALPSLQSQGWWILDGKIDGINAFHDKLGRSPRGEMLKVFQEPVPGIRAVDDFTLQIKLTHPAPQFIYLLTMAYTAPVAHEAVAAYGEESQEVADHPVGTGPFILAHWKRGKKIVLERNPTYHADFYPIEGSVEFRKRGLLADAGKPLPFLDRISIDVIKDQEPAWEAFLKGNHDLMGVPREHFPTAITNQVNLTPDLAAKGIRLHIDTSLTFWYISFNMGDRLLGSNKFLRQAISAAIDREKWIAQFTNGTGKKATTILPPGVPDRPEKQKIKYDYNLALAKELLKKAGYPEGRGLPELNFDLRGSDALNRQLGDFFTRQLAAIGVKLNVIFNTFPAFLDKMKKGDLQISYGGWSMDYPDAENAFQLLYGPNHSPGPNETGFNNPEMNRFYQMMSTMESGPRRAEIIEKMDDILQEDCPWALGYYQTTYQVSQPWVLNFRPADLILNRYKYLKINRDVKARYLEGNKQ